MPTFTKKDAKKVVHSNKRKSVLDAGSESDEEQWDQDDEVVIMMKRILVVVNTILFFASLALCILGILGTQQSDEIERRASLITDMELKMVATIICVMGGIAAFGCFCGAYAGWTESNKKGRLANTVYLVILFAAILIQLCMCIFMYLNDSEEVLDDIVEKKWFEEGDMQLLRREEYQEYFVCCGWASVFDSRASGYNTPCLAGDPVSCRQATMDTFNEKLYPMALFGLSIALLEALGLFATLYILCVRKQMGDEDIDDAED